MKKTILECHRFSLLLSTRDWRFMTDLDVKMIEDFIKSDGCTGVPEFYHNQCVKHDWWYRTHLDFDCSPITKREADTRFRQGIQHKSKFGFLSPMAAWRWLGVFFFAQSAWKDGGLV